MLRGVAVAVQADPWIRWDWVADHTDDIRERLFQHVELTVVALVIGLVLAVPIGVAAWRWRVLYPPVLAVMGVVYSIPSLALLVFLIPWTGLTTTTSEIMLVGYTLLILIRNTVAGLDSVPADVREAATGMGYSANRQLLRIELPLALPAIIAGIRITAVTTIGLVTITALIGQGGLGALIYDGLLRDFRTPLVVGTLLTVALAVIVDVGLAGAQRLLMPWNRRRVVEFLGDVVAWFSDPTNWQGEDGMPNRLQEHVAMCIAALLTAMVLALPVGLFLGHTGRAGALAINVSNLGRAVPSFAIIVLAAQWFEEIGAKPAFIALVALAIPPMVTNTLTAVAGVDPEVKESAVGMGLTGVQVLARVEVPMGMPLIMAGVRTSGVQIVATATLAALVGWGGLGRYIIDGLATRDFVEVFAGALAVAILSVVAEVSLGALQRVLVPKGLADPSRAARARVADTAAHHPGGGAVA